MQREQKNLDLTTSPSLYHRSSRDEGEVYTSVPVVVLTVHEAQEETHVKRSHFSYEAEDALPVGEVYLNKLSFFTFSLKEHFTAFSSPSDDLFDENHAYKWVVLEKVEKNCLFVYKLAAK